MTGLGFEAWSRRFRDLGIRGSGLEDWGLVGLWAV